MNSLRDEITMSGLVDQVELLQRRMTSSEERTIANANDAHRMLGYLQITEAKMQDFLVRIADLQDAMKRHLDEHIKNCPGHRPEKVAP